MGSPLPSTSSETWNTGKVPLVRISASPISLPSAENLCSIFINNCSQLSRHKGYPIALDSIQFMEFSNCVGRFILGSMGPGSNKRQTITFQNDFRNAEICSSLDSFTQCQGFCKQSGVHRKLLVLALGNGCINGAEAGRAFFVFGDSLVDNGNNNYLATTARADSPPYGIDYPTRRPTGRFSNGLNIPDFISQELGSEPTLPYLSPQLNGQKLLVGANFASAGTGILNDTGIQFINIIRIFRQLDCFQEYQKRVSALIGAEKTRRLVNGALVLITCGGNDFVNNYYLVPFSTRSRQFLLPDYVKYLISEYRKILRRLYDLGARRVLVTGTGPLGCVPAELALRSRNGECSAELQRAASLFNPQLVQMIRKLNREVGSDVFIAANTQLMHNDFVTNPQAYGFVTSKVACCGQGPYNGIGLCTLASNLCPNRDTYAFWDPFHPSEKANKLIVKQIMSGTTEYMYPMNLSTILALDSKNQF